MSVDFSPSNSVNTASGTSKPADMQTLQETFAAILRSYGTEKGGAQTNTLLEIAPLPNAGNKDRNQEHKEQQQQINRNDYTQIDRKQQDASEIRSSEMNSGYQERKEQQKTLQQDYKEKIEHSELLLSAARMESSPSVVSVISPTDAASPMESLPNGNRVPLQKNPPGIMSPSSQFSAASTLSAPNSGVTMGQASTGLPMNVNAPASMPSPVTPPSAPPQTFTVFTPLGRWGQPQEQSEEEENEKESDEEHLDTEKPDAGNISKKKQHPFAVFEAIRAETARSIQPNHARKPKEPVSQTERRNVVPLTEELKVKPKEREPEQARNVKTVEDLLHMAEQGVAMSKKREPNQPDESRYLHRIAAACEAAALYAPIRMKINLEHLGTLALRFFYKSEKLTLRFETPSNESAQFLREHMDGLKTILSGRSVKIADIEIVPA